MINNDDFLDGLYQDQVAKFDRIKQLIDRNNKIVILGHVHPDGDCIGAQLALLQSLQKQYPQKNIKAPFADTDPKFGFLLPPNYQGKIKAIDYQETLFIVVDTATKSRLPIKINEKKQEIIQIDHHPRKAKFATITWIDDQSISTCEMVYVLLKKLNWPINSAIANALLTGIITDSGNFCFPKTNAKTFWVAYQLMMAKANLIKINTNIHTKKEKDLMIIRWILSNYNKEKGLIWVKFLPKNKQELPFIKEEKELKKFVNLFANVDNINKWAMFVQINTQESIFVSIRSKKTAINHIAEKYGGGGHTNAAGIELSSWESVPKIIEELRK